MFNITPETIILIAIFLLIAFPVHEFAHAFVAWRLGDSTARMFGRLSLNPVVHFDPLGGLMLAITALSGTGYLFGWAKPTPVNPMNLRDRRNGEVLVALAGPASNLIMAALAAIVIRLIIALDVTIPGQAATVLVRFLQVNVWLMVFNLLPIPPLDGFSLLARFLPPRQVWHYRQVVTQYGLIILLVLIIPILPSGSVLGTVVGPIIDAVTHFLVGQ